VPDRFAEGYGMRPEVIERAAADGASLVISVDTGIRARESVARAAELGVDVVITDHHLPEESLPPAYAVINPNRPDCAYPEKSLCGAGVAFKLIQSLFRALQWPETRARSILASFLKMVSIATVADVVPLTGENRIIVRHGLDGLRTVHNPGLRALLDVAGFAPGDRPSAGQIAFRVAPRINAAGRMANASDVVDLFLTKDAGRAREIARQLHELNQERQQTEAAIVERILEECSREPVTDQDAALIFAGEDWHRGVVGIVASRVVERFHRPVFILSLDSEKGEAQGSGRSIPAFHLLDALESMSDLFTRFGGHRQAAGLSLPVGSVPEFRRRMRAHAAGSLTPADFRPVRQIDAILDFSEVSEQAVQDLLSLEPFGFGNPTPVFLAEGVVVDGEARLFKEKHLRVPLCQRGRRFWLKGWNAAPRIQELAPGSAIDVAFTIEDDPYSAARGYPGWNLVLKDLRTAGQPAEK
jgi:single-stranded-DNA-specific exonuclease